MKLLAGEHNFIMSCSLRKILGLFVTNVVMQGLCLVLIAMVAEKCLRKNKEN
jgi:hypothetical protein